MTTLSCQKFVFKVMKFLDSLRCVKESVARRIMNTTAEVSFLWRVAELRHGDMIRSLRHPRAAAACRLAIWSGRLLEVSLGRCTTHVQLSGDPEADS